MHKISFSNRISSKVAITFLGAAAGFLAWIMFVVVLRWFILLGALIFGIDWVPAFFGWGTIIFITIGVLLGLMVADEI